MKRTLILTIFIFSFFIGSACAGIEIKAKVDKTKLTTDEVLTYEIVVTSSENKIPTPQPPDFKGFEVLSSAQSSSVSFMKSNLKTVLVYTQ